MADPVDLTPLIAAEAAMPAVTETDGLKATGQKLADLIAADEYLARKAQARTGHGLRFGRFVPRSDYPDTRTP